MARQLLIHDPPPFPAGIWLVALATVEPNAPELRTTLAAAIGKALGFTFLGQRPIADQLFALLQKRRCLLLLDNFEQLIPPEAPTAGAFNAIDFVIELLEQAPHLQLLITSRRPLDLNSEFVVRLTGLPVPDATLPADAATYASVCLFAERSARITEHFRLDQQIGEVAAICRFVAGLPLGIELAAAWSGARTPIEILLALQANLDFLATHRRDIPPRQRSMRAVFDHSWQLLTVAAQQGLAQIACFRGGFTLAAAQAVLVVAADKSGAPPNLAKLLGYLVHHSLLHQDETGRYNIHALLRDYAAEKLTELSTASGEAQGIAQRHSRYYLALAGEAATQGWYTRGDLAPLYADLDNVRQAWQWASEQQDLVGLAQGWLGLAHFYAGRALFQEGEEAFRSAVEALASPAAAAVNASTAARGAEGATLCARIQVAHAGFLNALGRYQEAVRVVQPATVFAEAMPDDALQARGNLAWGAGLYRQAQYAAALAQLTQGLNAAQRAHLPLVAADLHKRLANTRQSTHDFAGARRHYAEALALYRQHRHRPGEAETLNALGWCSLQQHQLVEAHTYLDQAQQIQRAIDDPHGLSMTLINLAILYERQDDYEQAFAYRQQVLTLLKQFDDPYQAVLVNHGLGMLLSRLGDYTAAEPYYLRALEIDRTMGDPGGVAWTQNNLGLLYNHRGDYAAALALHQEALQTSIALGATTTEGLAWSRLGQDYDGLGDFEAAYDAYLKAIAIQTQLNQQVWVIESKSGLAATQLALHMHDEALAQVEEILAFLAEKSLAGAREPLRVYWHCYQVLAAKADPRAAPFLQNANEQLTTQAARLVDQEMKRYFLENVGVHHALRQAYKAALLPLPA